MVDNVFIQCDYCKANYDFDSGSQTSAFLNQVEVPIVNANGAKKLRPWAEH